MARFNITDEAYELHSQFTAEYSFITVSVETVQTFINTYKSKNLNLLYDYILSQDLAEEIEL